MNNARVWALIRERRKLLAGTPAGNQFMYRIGGGTCYYVVFEGGKGKLCGPHRKEIAKAYVEKINQAGGKAKYLGTRSAAKTASLL